MHTYAQPAVICTSTCTHRYCVNKDASVVYFLSFMSALQFKLRPHAEYIDWTYDRLNTFNERNRKFDYYPHGYVYECLSALNSYDHED